MDPLIEMLWRRFLAADRSEVERPGGGGEVGLLAAANRNNEPCNAIKVLDDLGWLVVTCEEIDEVIAGDGLVKGTGEVIARDGPYALMKKSARPSRE